MKRNEVVVRGWEFHSAEFIDRTFLGKDEIKGVSTAVGRGVDPEVKIKICS